MKTYEKILLENKAWAEESVKLRPDYFERLKNIKSPKIMWLGSTDSRVEINEITNTAPGEIIAYRNLANLVKDDCDSFMTVLRHALFRDKIDHIIICGHNHCRGIEEVLTDEPWDMVGDWLKEVNDLYHKNIDEFKGLSLPEKELLLAEINVREQIRKLIHIPEVSDLCKKEGRPRIHGWLYNCDNGLIRSLIEIEPNNIAEYQSNSELLLNR